MLQKKKYQAPSVNVARFDGEVVTDFLTASKDPYVRDEYDVYFYEGVIYE